MSTPEPHLPKNDELTIENEKLRAALKATILSLERVVESAERALKNAENRLAALRRDE